MRERFGYEIEALKQLLLDLAAVSQQAVLRAIRMMQEMNVEGARQVIDNDARIDEMEVRIEEECLKLIALYQPVAGDLRTLVTIMKVNNELERIADLASNIAARVIDMEAYKDYKGEHLDFDDMVEGVQQMLKNALDAFVYHEADLAQSVIRADDRIDEMNKNNYTKAREILLKSTASSGYTLDELTISHALERIADIATNICEDVIYLEKGEIVRHTKLI